MFSELPPDGQYGRVAFASRDRFLLWTDNGEVEATLSGRLRHENSLFPCVGDWVVVKDSAFITQVLPRRTQLLRKEPGKRMRPQVLAANIDVLFVVTGLDHDYNPRRLERYLVLAHDSGARPVVLLNKADLHADAAAFIADTEKYASGLPVLLVNAFDGSGFDQVPQHVAAGETAALIGSSGVGKSTILNRLLGGHHQATAPVRESDSKGRHTTTSRQLICMPGEWYLMDLPGLRELQLWADPEQIDNTFTDISELARDCRFRDCTHQNEPGCAVRDAELDPQRLSSYRKLQRELTHLEREANPAAARAERKKWNALEKNMRLHPKRIH